MNMMRFQRGIVGAIGQRPGIEPLTEDQLRALAPSIFAETKHESRSERYTYIPTIEIVRALQSKGFEPMVAKQGGSRVPGKAEFTKHLIRFRHGTHEMRQVGDTRPEIILINSHDGTSSYRILAGLFRLLCLNGLVAADSVVGDVRVGHTGKIIDEVIEGTWSVVGETHRVMDHVERFKSIELKPAEQLAFAEAAHALRFEDTPHNAEAIAATHFNVPRRQEDTGPDLWSTFNRIQENTIRGGLEGVRTVRDPDTGRVRRRRVSTREVRAIDQDVGLNRALWVLAEKMAELKA